MFPVSTTLFFSTILSHVPVISHAIWIFPGLVVVASGITAVEPILIHDDPLQRYIILSFSLYVVHHSFVELQEPYVAMSVEPFGTGAFHEIPELTRSST